MADILSSDEKLIIIRNWTVRCKIFSSVPKKSGFGYIGWFSCTDINKGIHMIETENHENVDDVIEEMWNTVRASIFIQILCIEELK